MIDLRRESSHIVLASSLEQIRKFLSLSLYYEKKQAICEKRNIS